MARYEIRTAGWDYMAGTSDAYAAQLEVHRDGSCWDTVPARIAGVTVLRAGLRDDRPRQGDEFWSALLLVAAAEVRGRIGRGERPSESAHGAAVYPCALKALEVARRDASSPPGPCIAEFDLKH